MKKVTFENLLFFEFLNFSQSNSLKMMISRPKILSLIATFIIGLQVHSQGVSDNFNRRGKKLAILIANADYKNLSKLNTPIKEIEKIEEYLKEKSFEILKFTNTKMDESQKIISDIHSKLNSGEHDFVYFHYAGHGFHNKNKNYVVPINVKNTTDEFTATHESVSLEELILEALAHIQKKYQIGTSSFLVFDACRNIPFESLSNSRGFTNLSGQPDNSEILFSSGPGTLAVDGLPTDYASPFCYELIKALKDCPRSARELCDEINGNLLQRTAGGKYSTPYLISSNATKLKFCNEDELNLTLKKKKIKEQYNGLSRSIQRDFQVENYSDIGEKMILINNLYKTDSSSIDLNNYFNLASYHLQSLERLNSFDKMEKYGELYHKRIIENENAFERIKFFDFLQEFQTYLDIAFGVNSHYTKSIDLIKSNIDRISDECTKLEIALAYDKLASNFEKAGYIDSALAAYDKASVLLSKTKIDDSRTASLAMMIFCNHGALLGSISRKEKSQKQLMKAIKLGDKFQLDNYYPKFELLNNALMDKETIDEILVEELLSEFKVAAKPNTQSMLDLLFFQQAYKEQTENKNDFRNSLIQFYDSLNSYSIVSLESKKLKTLSDENCNLKYLQYSISTDNNSVPILYFDLNNNNFFDSVDVKVKVNLDGFKLLKPIQMNIGLSVYLGSKESILLPNNEQFQLTAMHAANSKDNKTKNDYVLDFSKCEMNRVNEDKVLWTFFIFIDEIDRDHCSKEKENIPEYISYKNFDFGYESFMQSIQGANYMISTK